MYNSNIVLCIVNIILFIILLYVIDDKNKTCNNFNDKKVEIRR
jgi:hypothetical protein